MTDVLGTPGEIGTTQNKDKDSENKYTYMMFQREL